MRFIDLYEANEKKEKFILPELQGNTFWEVLENAIKSNEKLSTLACRFTHNSKKLIIKKNSKDEADPNLNIEFTEANFKRLQEMLKNAHYEFTEDTFTNIKEKLGEGHSNQLDYIKNTLVTLINDPSKVVDLNDGKLENIDHSCNAKWYKTWQDAVKGDAADKEHAGLAAFISRIEIADTDKPGFYINNIGDQKLGKNNEDVYIQYKNSDFKQPTDKFIDFCKAFKAAFGNNWKRDLENHRQWRPSHGSYGDGFKVWMALVDDPSKELTNNGRIRDTEAIRKSQNSAYGKPDDYRKLGQAMVFYSAKFLSAAANEETNIKDTKQLAYIMQGIFGEAAGKTEQASFLTDENLLTKLGGIKAKMTIDAAKAVVASKNNTNNNQGYRGESVEIQPFNHKDYLTEVTQMIRLISEANAEDAPKNKNRRQGTPATPGDFSNNPEEAYAQALDVKSAHPTEFDIEYEKLKSNFDEGIADYQKQLKDKDSDANKTGMIKNPVTGKMEKINHSGFGTGGPNAFIRKNPRLAKLVDNIKGQQWNIFNTAPKLLFMMFDAIEAGGQILQKLCDDLAKSWKGLKDLIAKLDPKEIQRRIDKMLKENNQTGAMEYYICNSILALYGVYAWVNNPHITIYSTQHAMSTMDEQDKNVAEPLLKYSAQKAMEIINNNEKAIDSYFTWKKMTDKRNENVKKQQKNKSDEKKENIIPTILHLEPLDSIKTEFAAATNDIKDKSQKLANLLSQMNTFSSENSMQKYLNDDFSNKSDLAASSTANDNENPSEDNDKTMNNSFELEPIDLSKYLIEKEEGDNSDDIADNAESSNDTENKETDPQQNSSSDIEKIAQNTQEGKANMDAIVEALNAIAKTDEFNSNILNDIITKCSKEESVVDGINKFKGIIDKVKGMLDAGRKTGKVENQVANIDIDNENSYVNQCKESHVKLIGKSVSEETVTKEDENNGKQSLVDAVTTYHNEIMTIKKSIFNDIITPIKNTFKDDAKTDVVDSSPENAEQVASEVKSLYDKTNDALNQAADNLKKAVYKFAESAKNPAEVKESYDPLFDYNDKLLPIPKIVYTMNIANLALKTISDAAQKMKDNSANYPPDVITKIEEIANDLKIPKGIGKLDTDENIDAINNGLNAIEKEYNITFTRAEDVGTKHEKIEHTLETIIELKNKVLLGFNGLLPDNQNNGLYWGLAFKQDDAFRNEFNKLQRAIGDTNLGLTANKGSSFIFGLRALSSFAESDNAKNPKFKNLIKIINDSKKDIDALDTLSKTRNTWNLLAYVSAADAILKRIKEAKLNDDEYKVILDGAKAGQKQEGNSEIKPGATGAGAEAAAADISNTSGSNLESVIPEFSPDMLINEIYKYIRGN